MKENKGILPDLIFVLVMFSIFTALNQFQSSGVTLHIVLSILGLALLVVYAKMTKKDWKLPALEVLMRVFYAVALITGIALMNVEGVAALVIAHKLCCLLSLVSLFVLFIHKIVKK